MNIVTKSCLESQRLLSFSSTAQTQFTQCQRIDCTHYDLAVSRLGLIF